MKIQITYYSFLQITTNFYFRLSDEPYDGCEHKTSVRPPFCPDVGDPRLSTGSVLRSTHCGDAQVS